MTDNVEALAMLGLQRSFRPNKSTVNKQKIDIMILKNNNEGSAGTADDSSKKADSQQVSPSIANAVLSDAFSFDELKIVSHSLGIDLFKAVISLKLKDKKLPLSFYRNYYNCSDRQAAIIGINTMVENGYMETRQKDYYHVSEKGIELFKKQFSELAIYKPKNEMNIDYLKNRINFYCTFYNYRFCDNNSEHVIEYAYKYFIGREYVSHTTKDVILRFKTELKKLSKEKAVAFGIR